MTIEPLVSGEFLLTIIDDKLIINEKQLSNGHNTKSNTIAKADKIIQNTLEPRKT